MFVKGDKIIVKKEFFNIPVGEIFEITNVENDLISFEKKTEYGRITSSMSTSFAEECFEKYEEEVVKEIPTITEEDIELIISDSEIETIIMSDKCTVVSCKLPNGFVITESVANPEEKYDEEINFEICLDRIKDKVWELEKYRLLWELYYDNLEEANNECDECENECHDCWCDHGCGNS